MLTTILFIIILTATSLAIEIDLNSPEKVSLEEEFLVSVEADSTDNFDVKIFVHNSEDQKIERSEYVSEIYDDGWKDPWYYLNEIFPEQTEFEIRVLEDSAIKICARLRNSETESVATECNTIKINTEEQEVSENEIEQTKRKETDEPESSREEIQKNQKPKETISFEGEQEKILLNVPIKAEEEIHITTKAQTKRSWILHSFLGFCIIIIILLSLKKL